MSTYKVIYYHLIFGTKNREDTLPEADHRNLYNYMWGVFKNKECHLYQINGTTNHIHFLFELHPSETLAGLVKDLKLSTSQWIKNKRKYPYFKGWQVGYGAFTKCLSEKGRVIQYIKNQKTHHRKVAFLDEYKRLLTENGIDFDERYLP